MTGRATHTMPFGAELGPGGAVRFRLWAPSARQVDVLLSESGRVDILAANALQDGWFELETPRAGAGSCYRYRIDAALEVPDPASRFNPEDVAGFSEVIDPQTFQWTDDAWRGHAWHEAVIYELHIGTFTPEGTYRAAARHLAHLKALGVTMLELMPLAEFPGRRGWGYDGVLPFAPESAYGRPDDLKMLIDAAHRIGLSVLIDVVYNHFGPEGNYLHSYAKPFFSDRHHTPWGSAINFDGARSKTVREFFIHNALYWLQEFHADGLRLDAVHAICDDSTKHILTELSERVRAEDWQRHVHLVLENGANEAHFLARPGTPGRYDAQWNDDVHHCLHVLLTGETDGYYSDYREATRAQLARCLTEGFAYQGEPSRHEGNKPRGEPSAALPPSAFVNFLQNHDQIGNRAFGDRLIACVRDEDSLHAALAILLLAPSPPMLFMGEEWGTRTPFPYFCDFHGELAHLVREGRRKEFAHFDGFSKAASADSSPDPGAQATFDSAKLRWDELDSPPHRRWLERYRILLAARRRFIVPELPTLGAARILSAPGAEVLEIDWQRGSGGLLRLSARLSASSARAALRAPLPDHVYSTHPEDAEAPWLVRWSLAAA